MIHFLHTRTSLRFIYHNAFWPCTNSKKKYNGDIADPKIRAYSQIDENK